MSRALNLTELAGLGNGLGALSALESELLAVLSALRLATDKETPVGRARGTTASRPVRSRGPGDTTDAVAARPGPQGHRQGARHRHDGVPGA